MNKSNLESIISDKGFAVITAKGFSMLPFIRPDSDHAVLFRPDAPPNKYDVILYRNSSGIYVLHRIVGKNENGYILCGDNQTVREYNITEDKVIAVLKGIYRNDKYVNVNSKKYRLFVRIWHMFDFTHKIFIVLNRKVHPSSKQ